MVQPNELDALEETAEGFLSTLSSIGSFLHCYGRPPIILDSALAREEILTSFVSICRFAGAFHPLLLGLEELLSQATREPVRYEQWCGHNYCDLLGEIAGHLSRKVIMGRHPNDILEETQDPDYVDAVRKARYAFAEVLRGEADLADADVSNNIRLHVEVELLTWPTIDIKWLNIQVDREIGRARQIFRDCVPRTSQRPKETKLTPAQEDIVAVIRSAGHRLTTTQVLKALADQEKIASEGTTKNYLAELMRGGHLTNRQDTAPPGYGLKEWDADPPHSGYT